MAKITAADVNALRKRTGMGMMECKKALTEGDGDTEKAVELLRKWAGGKMADRGDREASEGVVAVAVGDGAAAAVKVLAETDFAALNDAFQSACRAIAEEALTMPGTGDVTGSATDSMKAKIEDLRITIKENIQLKELVRFEGESFGTYVHTNHKQGAIVALSGSVDDELAKGLAMHVTAAVPPVTSAPLAVDAEGLPQADVDEARSQFEEEAKATGKPEQIATKIAEGKLNKWKDERTLMGQTYIRQLDDNKPVRDYLPDGVKVTGFHRLAVG